MQKYTLDYALVPLGLLVMAAYHAWLLRRVIRHPDTTVIGINAANRRLWIRAMMEVFLSFSLLLFFMLKKD